MLSRVFPMVFGSLQPVPIVDTRSRDRCFCSRDLADARTSFNEGRFVVHQQSSVLVHAQKISVPCVGGVLAQQIFDLRHAGACPVLDPRLGQVILDVMKAALVHKRMIGE